jgi:hypothetical protein
MACCKKSSKTTIPTSEFKHTIEILKENVTGYNNNDGSQVLEGTTIGTFLSYVKTTNTNTKDFFQTEESVGINISNVISHKFYVKYTPMIPLNSGALIVKFQGNKYRISSAENVNYNSTEILLNAVIQTSA